MTNLTNTQINKLKEVGIPIREIDPELVNVLYDLNSRGYKTAGSCAGHTGSPSWIGNYKWGFIIFNRKVEGEFNPLPIMKKHGLRNIHYRVLGVKPHELVDTHCLLFSPVGVKYSEK